MEMVYGIVTAAGLGTRSGLDGRLRKELLPLYDIIGEKLVLRPVIDIVIRRLEDAGCTSVVVVLDPDDELTIKYLERNFDECEIHFQEEKLGYGDAVYRGIKKNISEDIVVNAGDGVVLDEGYYKKIVSCKKTTLTLFRVETPERYGNAKVDENESTVLSVVEKPKIPLSDLALGAVYYFQHDHLKHIKKNEKELTTCISEMINNGKVFYNEISGESWLSIGRKEKYHEVLLRSFKHASNIL